MSNQKTSYTSKEDYLLEKQVAIALCKIIDTPRALSVMLLLESNEVSQYLALKIDPNHYTDAERFADDYLVTKVLSKSPNLPTDIDRKAVAFDAFMASELKCRDTNARFTQKIEPHRLDLVLSVRWEIAKILGNLTPRALDRIADNFSHGPGSSRGVPGVRATTVDKFSQPVTMTPNLIPFYRAIIGDRWANAQKYAVILKGNRFFTVPKNAETERGAGLEPTGNIYIQKGIGAYIRARLKQFDLDLDTCSERNRELASLAYKEKLCTIDLKAASDSIALRVVETLMTPEWFHLLSLSRSPCTLIGGQDLYLEKIASMGNGWTFELESLIFYSIVRCVVPYKDHDRISVFGDDIICPQAYASKVIDALEFFGFSVNGSKSFLDGCFFESCGRDCFKGIDVRPFFLRGRSPNIPYALQVANRLRMYSNLRSGGAFCDSRFRDLWKLLISKIPSRWRLYVPPACGDVGIISDVYPRIRVTGEIEGHMVRVLLTRPKKIYIQSFFAGLETLARAGKTEVPNYGRYVVRGIFDKPRTKLILIHKESEGFSWT